MEYKAIDALKYAYENKSGDTFRFICECGGRAYRYLKNKFYIYEPDNEGAWYITNIGIEEYEKNIRKP